MALLEAQAEMAYARGRADDDRNEEEDDADDSGVDDEEDENECMWRCVLGACIAYICVILICRCCWSIAAA